MSLVHLVLSTVSPVFHRASPFFPTAETVCLAPGQATCSCVHSCRGLFLWPGHGRSPSLGRHVCQLAGVRFKRWRSQRQLA